MYIGYRCWFPFIKNGEYFLESLVSNYTWDGPVVDNGDIKDHLADRDLMDIDGINHEYGFFSYNKLSLVEEMIYWESHGSVLLGAIQPFGKVVRYERGYRSEKAMVMAIIDTMGCDHVIGFDGAYADICQEDSVVFNGTHFFCEEHSQKRDRDGRLIFLSEENGFIETEYALKNIARKYQCDILGLEELRALKEKYKDGPW